MYIVDGIYDDPFERLAIDEDSSILDEEYDEDDEDEDFEDEEDEEQD